MESTDEEDPPQKRQKSCDERGLIPTPVDRISDLPESIICHILSFLPTKSAVATGFLSKRWRLQWTKVTTFDFDDRLWANSKRTIPRIFDGAVPKMNFVEFVNMVLLNLSPESSICKFRLSWENHKFRSVFLNIWVNMAITRNVRVIDLDLSTPSPEESDDEQMHHEFQLPGALYSCPTLEVLKLRGPFLIKIPHVVCLPKLVNLELNLVIYGSQGSFHELICCCPALQSLRIERNHYHDFMVHWLICSPVLKRLEIYFNDGCKNVFEADEDYKLEIHAPALEYLVLHDSVSKEILFDGLTSVSVADLGILCSTRAKDRNHHNSIVELVQAFSHVKFLKVSKRTMRGLGEATNKLSANFERLTTLIIQVNCCQWSCLMDVISCCTALEVLDITKFKCSKPTHSACWKDPTSVPKCFSSSLMRVSYRGFRGQRDELSMLKFILDHAVVMKIIYLFSASDNGDSQLSFKRKFRILNKISMCARASPACKISYF